LKEQEERKRKQQEAMKEKQKQDKNKNSKRELFNSFFCESDPGNLKFIKSKKDSKTNLLF
jgi:exonuclease I